jgi:hypothetical protein
MIIHFNVGYSPGSMKIKSYLTEYDDSDIESLNSKWNETRTYWVNKTDLAKLEEIY